MAIKDGGYARLVAAQMGGGGGTKSMVDSPSKTDLAGVAAE